MFPSRLLCILLATTAPLAASAQGAAREPVSAYPSRTVRIVVPLAAGGPTDMLARIIAQPLSKRLGQTVVICNKPGAGGNIGADSVAKSHTPHETVQRLNREVMAVLQDPHTREQMFSGDFTPTGSTPEQFGRFIQAEAAKWGAIVNAKAYAPTERGTRHVHRTA